jgi:hypothetical protein
MKTIRALLDSEDPAALKLVCDLMAVAVALGAIGIIRGFGYAAASGIV